MNNNKHYSDMYTTILARIQVVVGLGGGFEG
jgi:hypothetical protein